MLRNTFKIREGDSAIGRSFGCPLPFWTGQSFYYYEPKNLVYLSNAKAGCSTIKSSFLLAIHKHLGMEPPRKLTDIHRKHPFWELNIGNCIDDKSNFFSLVRNPYTRILSAYLDKIAMETIFWKNNILENIFWYRFCLKNDRHPENKISFVEFLRVLEKSTSFKIEDQHFRPQVENIYAGSVGPIRVHYLENFSNHLGALTDYLDWHVEFPSRRGHSTDAHSKLPNFVNGEAEEIIQRLYHDDFESFGYSRDPADAMEAPDKWITLPQVDVARQKTIRLFSLARIPKSQQQMLDLAAKGPQSFLDRLCVAKHVLDRRDPKSRELERTFDHQITTGNASERLAIHDCRAHFAERDRDFARERASLEECMKLTEEVIGFRFRMISCLINLKDVEAASAELGKFRLTTWNEKMVAVSQEKLDNLIAESA